MNLATSRPKIFALLTLLALYGLAATSAPSCQAKGKDKDKDEFVFQAMVPTLDPLPPPKVLRGAVAETALMAAPPTNAFGFAMDSDRYPGKITYVTPNSVAWRGGLQTGDKIINGRVEPLRALLIVGRGGKKYGCVLRLSALSAQPDDPKKLGAGATKSDTQTLTSYQVVMVVDGSASMATKDCPGGMSRWQWCRDHIGDLYAEEKGALQKNISIVTFDSNFRSRQTCSPSELQSIFAQNDPVGESNMGPALDEAFQLVRRQLDTGRPAIVSVISDGRPSDVDRVRQAIIRETNSLRKPQLLSLVFIEVGTPEHYLKELDNDLVKQGAAADIVTVIPFASASSQGLSKTLVGALPKTPEPKSTLSGAASASGVNQAKQAISSHIFTYSPPSPGQPAPPVRPQPPVRPRPQVQPAPPVKAHPAGTSAADAAAVAKPIEVDEKDAALRGSANKIYK